MVHNLFYSFGQKYKQRMRISPKFVLQNYVNTGTGTLSRKASYTRMQEKNGEQTWKFVLKELQAHITLKSEDFHLV